MRSLGTVVAPSLLVLTGCAQLLGIDEYESGGGGTPGTTTSTGASPTSSTGAGSPTSSSTGGGPCTGSETRACYGGPPGTENVGNCIGGMETCNGTTFGPCVGEVRPAPEDFYTVGDESCDGVPRGDLIWAKAFDPTIVGLSQGMHVDPQGNGYVLGLFEGDLNFGATPAEALPAPANRGFYVTSFTSDGTHRWSTSFEADYDSTLASFAVDASGNVFLFGLLETTLVVGGQTLSGDNDYFLVKLDPDGKVLSSRIIPANYRTKPLVSILPDGSLVLAGGFAQSLTIDGRTISTSDAAVFVARCSATTLSCNSLKKVGEDDAAPDGFQLPLAMDVDAAGKVYLAGTFTYQLTWPGGLLTSSTAGDFDAFLLRLGQDDTIEWTAQLGTFTGADIAFGIDVADDGSLAATGRFVGDARYETSSGFGSMVSTTGAGDADVFLWKVDVSGKTEWLKDFGDSVPQDANDPVDTSVVYFNLPLEVSLDASGRVAVSGGMPGVLNFGGDDLPSAGDIDAYLAVFEPDGTHAWSKRFGNAGPLQGTSGIRFTPDGRLYLSLFNAAKMDLGAGELSATTPIQLIHAAFAP